MNEIISSKILDAAEDLAQQFKHGDPFPHVVMENFFVDDVAIFLATKFPTMDQMPNVFREPMSYKGQLSDIDGKWPEFSEIFRVLQSKETRNFFSKISGICNLKDDSILAGGGLHQSPANGFLDLHVDANFHPIDKMMHRRLNLIVYLNRGWSENWGGDLQLWSDEKNKPKKLCQSVMPAFNRAVLFATTRTSWHGVGPVNCPNGNARKSLALYYYTDTRPESELYSDSSVIWMGGESAMKRALYPAMNFAIRILKPYAKYLRRNVFDAAKK
ncbi:2OG-Fe(II) oxygenase [Robbsia andropogonis]|uniref:2OG-Fe(II) oxygenase n=1 Tax=Robbsia andropogonis TaxID=28092 RepID=UPI002A6B5E56|nr:2OG-Fe(II) oxygenase [Robbsia andropogonis]